ncbi:hypothetical protein BC939DRAFT_172672 [Gamsiella multidivaricata]|uniref:uncharacterized protein n=1 Tax=Gamsiella multidivaricata TaxID=101098 RepID=UPI00221E5CF3|nr:uncharacterized protein BC939DRAFT_172672 [Gamsiella multidivaricata]KAG0352462.1 hypothetical protein BGZ54_002779 [Gamsiella multidivaricata]KAI7822868.1 hypothetical protein BC939DRAFT_172672 [Gamsiella multidivaricata]
MRFSIFAIAATLVSAVLAQEVFPTSPIANTVWYKNTNATIRWKVLSPTTDKQKLKIDLLSGPTPQTMQVVDTFGTFEAGAKSAVVAVSKSLATGWYTLRIGENSYTHTFLIKTDSKETYTVPEPQATTTTIGLPTTTLPSTTTTTTATATGLPSGSVSTSTPTPTNRLNAASGFLKSGSVLSLAASAAVAIAASLAL